MNKSYLHVHGCGFAHGSVSEGRYSGAKLAMKENVVVVTINHRLNLAVRASAACLTN